MTGRRRCFALFLIAAAAGFVGCGRDPEDRVGAIYDLKAAPTAENLARIRTLLDDANRDVRATALHAIAGSGAPDAGPVALAALDDEDGFVRATAAKLLGDLREPLAAAPLAARLAEDAVPIVRQRAAEALGEIGGEEAQAGLIAGLADPMQPVRTAAVESLRRVGAEGAKAELARLVLEDAAWEVRVQALHALGTTGDPDLLPLLEAARADPNEFVRSAAGQALRVHRGVASRKAAER